MADLGSRSLAGIEGSNTAGGMDVCPLLLYLYVVLSSAEALQGVLQGVCQK
jgi:hypothetical protein